MEKSIVLIGFMGCGKSTVGSRLSYRMRIPMEDTDKIIECEQGVAIREIFAQKGEETFRAMETELLSRLAERKCVRIISVGGGTPVREENRALLKKCGTVFYFRLRPESVYKRLRGDTTRPLLQCEDPLERIRTLLEQRSVAYEESADYIIDVDELSVDQVADRVLNCLDRKM